MAVLSVQLDITKTNGKAQARQKAHALRFHPLPPFVMQLKAEARAARPPFPELFSRFSF